MGIVFLLGAATGGLSNVTSGGAGVFTILLLARFEGMSIQEAVGTVLAASTIFLLVGAITFYRKKQIDGQLSITVGLAGVAGSFFAATLASSLQSLLIERTLGLFTLLVAIYTIFQSLRLRRLKISSFSQLLKNDNAGSADQLSRWRKKDPIAIAVQVSLGTSIGVATGLFGVAGAGLTMATFFFVFKLRARMVLGTSLTTSFFRYAGGSVGYFSTGLINPLVFLLLSSGGAIGSIFGAKFATGQMRGSYIQLVMIALLLITGIEFLIR